MRAAEGVIVRDELIATDPRESKTVRSATVLVHCVAVRASLPIAALFAAACAKEPPVAPVAAPLDIQPLGPQPVTSAQPAAAPEKDRTCRGTAAVGRQATPFRVPGAAFESGHVTLVDFCASWCAPCQKSLPKYEELYAKYKASGFDVVAVSVDEDHDDVKSLLKTTHVTFPVGWDEGRALAECYKPQTMPTAYVVDKNGIVRHVHHGYRDGEEKEIEKEIKALL